MKIAIIGINGRSGSRIADEARLRKHKVMGISRHVEEGIQKSVLNLTVEDLKGVDVVVSAFAAWENTSEHLAVAKHLDQILKGSNARWIIVGGAGCLYVSEGVKLVDTPEFPEEYKSVAYAMGEALDFLKDNGKSNWSFFSPPALFEPGEKTGNYQLGNDFLLTDQSGESKISMEDYAVAMMDIIEQNKFNRTRFTVSGV